MSSETPTLVIGLDAATVAKKVGYAIADIHRNKASIRDSGPLKDLEALTELEGPISGARGRVLVAIDAPLGWPMASTELGAHRAGEVLKSDAKKLFSRNTDGLIGSRTPLEVGANLIARTAEAALRLLDRLRKITGRKFPLAWDPAFAGDAVIEVYPAATLDRHLRRKYEGARENHEGLTQVLDDKGIQVTSKSPHVRDAGVCIVAAMDFLAGDCLRPQPDQMEKAKKEGWIWVKRQT